MHLEILLQIWESCEYVRLSLTECNCFGEKIDAVHYEQIFAPVFVARALSQVGHGETV